MLYFYPIFSEPDLIISRKPGAGLGNLLFPWARAEVFARQHGGMTLMPTWRNFKVGTYLRQERDKRTYGDLFKHRTIRDIRHILYARRLRDVFSETEFLKNSGLKHDGADTLITVSGMADEFSAISGEAGYLRQLLLDRARLHPRPVYERIAVHVRLGDFGPVTDVYSRNNRIPVEWFRDEILRIRTIIGDLPVVVFTDDTSGQAQSILSALPDVEFFTSINAISDILSMATAKHLITSSSTFSLWAAYLSDCTVSSRFDELFEDYGLNSPSFVSRILQ